MDKITPGRKLILDLLAKSVAKIQSAGSENIQNHEGPEMGKSIKKRKFKKEETQQRKKIKKERNMPDTKSVDVETEAKPKPQVKEEYYEPKPLLEMLEKEKHGKTNKRKESTTKNEDEIKREVKPELEEKYTLNNILEVRDIKDATIKIKTEYTEMKTENLVENDDTDENLEALRDNHKIKLPYKSLAKFSTNCVKKELDIEDVCKKVNHDFQTSELEMGSNKMPKTVNHKKKPENKNRQERHSDGNHEDDGSKTPDKKYKRKCAGVDLKKFTKEEDEILKNAMENFEKINFSQIAKDLGRSNASIRQRVDKLKTGKSWKEHRAYSLEEDYFILDAVLKHLENQPLETLNLTNSDWGEVGSQIGRGANTRTRWVRVLKPWILQHYSGTLNLDIKRPLANYLVDNFQDIKSIDWSSVCNIPDFAGHTQTSLSNILFTTLFQQTIYKLGKTREDITLEMIAEVVNAEGHPRRTLERNLKRQKEIIDYFVHYVETNHITNFL